MLPGSHASANLDIDLGILISGQTESLLNPPRPLVPGIGLAKREFSCTPIQASKMRGKLERPPSISPNNLVDGISELEPPIIDGNGGLLPRKKAAVDERDVGHWLNFRTVALLRF